MLKENDLFDNIAKTLQEEENSKKSKNIQVNSNKNGKKRVIKQTSKTETKKGNTKNDSKKRVVNKPSDNVKTKRKKATKESDYKKVNKYENAEEDVTKKRKWKRFKICLVAMIFAGSLTLGNCIANSFKNTYSYKSVQNVVSTSLKNKKNFKNGVIEKDGYHFDNLTEDEFEDGYDKISEYEEKLTKSTINNSILSVSDGDQKLLDTIIEESLGSSYSSMNENQKRDYKQLAYELLSEVLSSFFKNDELLIRNPIVVDVVNAKKSARDKGYTISLMVNDDETETVKNLGNIMHLLNVMEDTEYKNIDQTESSHEQFFENILIDSMGETAYNALSDKEKSDYKQITYELLSDDAKLYINDPIEIEKDTDNLTR